MVPCCRIRTSVHVSCRSTRCRRHSLQDRRCVRDRKSSHPSQFPQSPHRELAVKPPASLHTNVDRPGNTGRGKRRTEELVAQPADSRTRRDRHDPRAHTPSQTFPAISFFDDAQSFGHAAGISYSGIGRGSAGLQESLEVSLCF